MDITKFPKFKEEINSSKLSEELSDNNISDNNIDFNYTSNPTKDKLHKSLLEISEHHFNIIESINIYLIAFLMISAVLTFYLYV